MTRSMAHNAQRCGGLVSCSVCLDRVWNGKTPVMTPVLDALFAGFATVVVVAFCLYMAWHLLRVVTS